MQIVHRFSGCALLLIFAPSLPGCVPAAHPVHLEPAAGVHVPAPTISHATCPHVPDPVAGIAPPPPPSGKAVLAPSHWEWVDGRYAWMPLEWVPRPEGAARTWQDGYWESNGGACVWHNGKFLPAPAL